MAQSVDECFERSRCQIDHVGVGTPKPMKQVSAAVMFSDVDAVQGQKLLCCPAAGLRVTGSNHVPQAVCSLRHVGMVVQTSPVVQYSCRCAISKVRTSVSQSSQKRRRKTMYMPRNPQWFQFIPGFALYLVAEDSSI